MYASPLKWTKKSKNGKADHWTLRRSLRRSLSKAVAPPSAKASGEKTKNSKQEKATMKKKNARKSKKAIREETESKQNASDNEDLSVKKVKIGKSLQGYEITHESGARIKVALFGGTITSYRSADGRERLFNSKVSKTDGSKPLRGGVPIVFPQFGAGELPNHGFARTAKWELCSGDQAPHVEDGMVHVALKLTENSETKKMWKHKFELVHMIRFNENELETSMNITNSGKSKFRFQSILHTYLKTRDVTQISISGLQDHRVIDKLQYYLPEDGPQVWIEEAEELKINSEIDNIYVDAGKQNPIVVTSPEDNTKIEINVALCKGNDLSDCDVVVWNPWKAKSSRTKDLTDDAYKNFVCIEPGCGSREEICKPGETWTITQNMRFTKLNKYGVN